MDSDQIDGGDRMLAFAMVKSTEVKPLALVPERVEDLVASLFLMKVVDC